MNLQKSSEFELSLERFRSLKIDSGIVLFGGGGDGKLRESGEIRILISNLAENLWTRRSFSLNLDKENGYIRDSRRLSQKLTGVKPPHGKYVTPDIRKLRAKEMVLNPVIVRVPHAGTDEFVGLTSETRQPIRTSEIREGSALVLPQTFTKKFSIISVFHLKIRTHKSPT